MSEKTVSTLLQDRTDLYSLLCNLEEQIKITKNNIKHIDTDLKKLCKHDWERFNSGGSYSEVSYVCNICSISKY